MQFFFYNLTKVPKITFDEVTWMKKSNDRYKMIDDLITSDYLIDKDSLKIKTVFGDPLKVDEKREKYTYELIGRSWSEFIIIELILYFENGKVKRFESLHKK